jgi:hypothetical protein
VAMLFSRDIFVVAGSKQQFQNLCNEAQRQWDFELKNNMVRYVDDHRQLLSISKPCRVFCYGTYHRRKDWLTIYSCIVAKGHKMLRIR